MVETAEFLLPDLRTAQGCFAASLDADSEGREGAFYVWTPAEVMAAGADPDELGVTAAGTFEPGTSVLQCPSDPPEWPPIREHLRGVREQRPKPARDDKVVLAWNAWTVTTLAEAGTLLGRGTGSRPRSPAGMAYGASTGARHAPARLPRRYARSGAGRARRPRRTGPRGVHADCGDWGRAARGPAPRRALSREFLDAGRDTAATDLIASAVDMTDNATPSGWNLAAEALLTASALTGDVALRARAETALGDAAHLVGHPQFWGHGLSVLATSGPLCEGRPAIDAQDTAYVGFVCDAPTTDAQALAGQVGARMNR